MPKIDMSTYQPLDNGGGQGKIDMSTYQPLDAAAAPDQPQEQSYGDYLKSISSPQSAVDFIKGIGKGAIATVNDVFPLTPIGTITNALRGKPLMSGLIDQNTDASNQAQRAGNLVEGGAELAVPFGEIGKIADGTRVAGQVFSSIAKDAAKVPVSLSAAVDPLLELHDLGQTGSTLPKAVRQLTSRATAPNGAPILYPEARKFASNISGLSVADRMRATPNVKRVMGALREGLNADIGNAAGAVGRQADYEKAMQQYADAKRLRKIGAGIGGAALAGGAKAVGAGTVLGIMNKIGGQ